MSEAFLSEASSTMRWASASVASSTGPGSAASGSRSGSSVAAPGRQPRPPRPAWIGAEPGPCPLTRPAAQSLVHRHWHPPLRPSHPRSHDRVRWPRCTAPRPLVRGRGWAGRPPPARGSSSMRCPVTGPGRNENRVTCAGKRSASQAASIPSVPARGAIAMRHASRMRDGSCQVGRSTRASVERMNHGSGRPSARLRAASAVTVSTA